MSKSEKLNSSLDVYQLHNYTLEAMFNDCQFSYVLYMYINEFYCITVNVYSRVYITGLTLYIHVQQ